MLEWNHKGKLYFVVYDVWEQFIQIKRFSQFIALHTDFTAQIVHPYKWKVQESLWVVVSSFRETVFEHGTVYEERGDTEVAGGSISDDVCRCPALMSIFHPVVSGGVLAEWQKRE